MARKKVKRSEGLPEDMEDEVDIFHKGKDKISLNTSDHEESEEDLSEDDIDVYNLGGSEEEEEDAVDSDSESEGRLADRESPFSSSLSSIALFTLKIEAESDVKVDLLRPASTLAWIRLGVIP